MFEPCALDHTATAARAGINNCEYEKNGHERTLTETVNGQDHEARDIVSCSAGAAMIASVDKDRDGSEPPSLYAMLAGGARRAPDAVLA
jgi:hypothetical protein